MGLAVSLFLSLVVSLSQSFYLS